MNVAILLPYKENFSKNYAGAVSIFVNSTYKLSKFKKDILIYGSTNERPMSKNYRNIEFSKKFFQSSSKNYLKFFLNKIKNKKLDILEVHNRPNYINYFNDNSELKIVLYFHNDPLKMQGSVAVKERIELYAKCDLIIFNSEWTKNQFLFNLPEKYNSDKLIVVHQSTSKYKVNFKHKKKIISFIGKLNESKGYDIFGEAVLKILDKYPDWSVLVIGDEPRQKLFFNHERFKNLGYKNNEFILNKLKEVSISVIPSKWDEPFGRASLEASSRGCAIIRSNTGGLAETAKHSLILNKLTANELYKNIELLITNVKLRKDLQKKNYNNFELTDKYTSDKIDRLRKKLLIPKVNFLANKQSSIKILHITNFNERFDGRLHYNTGKRINNGLIRLGHNVLSISDRDIVSMNRSLLDPNSKKHLKEKIINNFNNFNPDLIVLGHADNVSLETLDFLKTKKKDLKIFQWFLDPITRNGPDYKNNKKRLLQKIKYLDASFITTSPDALDFNIDKCFYIPNPADKSFEILNNYQNNCSYDLFFAMSHGVHRGTLKKGKVDDREKFLKKIIDDKQINSNLFGINNVKPVWGKDFLNEISKCKMGLNLSRGKPVKYYSSDRIAQLMGNGLLTFIDEKTEYNKFFNKNEIITYKNLSDLIEKIHKYKKDDSKRKLIAKNGKQKYLKYFNSTVVSKFMINKTFEIKSKEKFYWN